MKQLTVAGLADPIEVKTNRRLLDYLTEQGSSITSACGGKGLCATCHVYVIDGMSSISKVTPRERRSLAMLTNCRPNSRLACQAKIKGPGIHIEVPHGRYLSQTSDLESLVGRRAEQPILHPVDGHVLIQLGKIITRSRIRQLAQVDIDVLEMRQRSLTIGK